MFFMYVYMSVGMQSQSEFHVRMCVEFTLLTKNMHYTHTHTHTHTHHTHTHTFLSVYNLDDSTHVSLLYNFIDDCDLGCSFKCFFVIHLEITSIVLSSSFAVLRMDVIVIDKYNYGVYITIY